MENKESCNQFLIRNLKDASCDEKFIETFLKYYEVNDIDAQIRLLKCHRCTLLEKLHEKQKQIDSLDYLLYTLKKCKEMEEK